MIDHLLDLHGALLEVGEDELRDLPPIDSIDDLAQRITATFRRTLPALRIASKWLRANFKYVV
jgi:protein SMG7